MDFDSGKTNLQSRLDVLEPVYIGSYSHVISVYQSPSNDFSYQLCAIYHALNYSSFISVASHD